jgi:hemoglobin-like flavoprotein
MIPAQISLVREGFALFQHRRSEAAALFFDQLFALDPTLRLLFPGDLQRRGARLMNAVELIVADLHRLHVFVPALEALAVRHFGYGLQLSHFAIIGEALKRTAASLLGEGFTAEIGSALDAVYRRLITVMIDAIGDELPLAA